MTLLSIGFLTKKHLYPFFMGINYFALELSTLISRNWGVYSSKGGTNYFNHHPFFMTWVMFLSKIPYIFIYFIQSKLSRDDYTSIGLINPKEKNTCSDYESYEICNTGSSVKIEDVLSTIGYISRHREIILLLFIVFLCYMFLMCLEY